MRRHTSQAQTGIDVKDRTENRGQPGCLTHRASGDLLARRVVPVLGFLALLMWQTAPSRSAEPCQCDQPRIKFLDDLFEFPHPVRKKDPFAERIETERHDFTQSTRTVGYHVAQIEAGYTYFYNDRDGEREQLHSTPEGLLRVGLSDDIEFRVRFDYSWRFIQEEEKQGGATDLHFGVKLGVTDHEGYIPESAMEIRFSAPTGASTWSTERVEFGLDYIYEWHIGECWDLYGSTGFATDGLADFEYVPDPPDADRFMVWHQSVALGVELTERTTMYTEWFGVFSHGRAEEKLAHTFNVGVDYYVTDNLVVDVRAGVGLNDDTDDFFTGVGGGYRF